MAKTKGDTTRRHPTLFILVGPKGCGKTHIGTLLQQRLGIEFLRVEDLWLTVRAERFSAAYIRAGLALVERAIAERFRHTDRLIVESTAAHAEFADFLARLRVRCTVRLIRITAPPALCLERIHRRDHTVHIPVSDDHIALINAQALSVTLPFDLTLDNTTADPTEIVAHFSTFLNQSPVD